MALFQNTEEWLDLRFNKIGSSDAPVILNESPFKSPFELWQEKLLKRCPPITYPMIRGQRLEEEARQAFEELTGIVVMPMVVYHPSYDFIIASLDGMDLTGESIVEIKCPGKKDHEAAQKGCIPKKYLSQVQHQIEVCQVDMAYYFSYYNEESVLLKIYRDDKKIKQILEAEKIFWECLENFTIPE